MGFLAPWFLAGAAAVGLPLYLHLLRRHTTTPHPFSSLMFFEQRTQSSIKHRRLRYLLLLSLRLASCCCWCSRLPNPYINRPAASAAGEKLVTARRRQFLQHARGFAPGRREARGALRAGFAKSRRARAGDGARLASFRC